MPQEDANTLQTIMKSAVMSLQKLRLNNSLAYSDGLCPRQLSLVLFIRILSELSFLRPRPYSFIARLQSDATRHLIHPLHTLGPGQVYEVTELE
jgi:hypothetical protein